MIFLYENFCTDIYFKLLRKPEVVVLDLKLTLNKPENNEKHHFAPLLL